MSAPSRKDDGRRWHRAGQTAAAQVAARVVSAVCMLVQARILLGYTGTETFGWMMAVTAFVGLSQFVDCGAAIALQQQLAVAWASGDDGALQTVFHGGRRLLWRLSALWLAPGIIFCIFGGRHFLPAPDGSRQFMSWLVIVVAVTSGLRFSVGPRLAAAVQVGWVAAAWTAAVNVAALAAIAVAAHLNAGSSVLVAIIAASQVVPGVITEYHMKFRLGWKNMATSAAAADEAARSIWKEGKHYALPNLAGAALQVATPAIFARCGGYDANAAFSLLQRLYGLLVQGHSLVLMPLWPAYAEAEATGDRSWVRRSFAVSIGMTAACIVVIAGIAVELPLITRLWLSGSAPVIPVSVALLVGLWSAANLLNQAMSYLLLGLGVLTRIAVGVGFAHLATIGAMLALGHAWGAVGVAAGLAGGCIVFATPQFAWLTASALGGSKDSTKSRSSLIS